MPPTRAQRSTQAHPPDSIFQGISKNIANEVSLNHQLPYAAADFGFWSAARTTNEFKRLDICTIEKDDQECGICRDTYSNGPSHNPVRLSCGHIVGLTCIVKWFNIITTSQRRAYPASSASAPRATCPFCRKILFPAPSTRESFFELTIRMMLWTHMYSKLRIRRNEFEEATMNDIIQFCLTWLDTIEDKKQLILQVNVWDFDDLYDYLVYQVDEFTFRLESGRLTRLQETKRSQLFVVALDWLDEFSRPILAGYRCSKPGKEWIWQVTPTIPKISDSATFMSLRSAVDQPESNVKQEYRSA